MGDQVPVLVGCAALQQQLTDFMQAREAIDLMTDACMLAAQDAGSAELLKQCQCILVPQGMWPYSDPARHIAQAIGADNAVSVLVKIGVLQQTAIADACGRITAGDCDIAIVVGGEARYRALQAQIAGQQAPETVMPGAPDEVMEPEAELWLAAETQAGLAMPVGFYALIESAWRFRQKLGIEQHRDAIAQLYSDFSKIAVNNPDAWKRDFVSAQTIRDASAQNKMLAFPYTKLHNTSWNVDQASALIFCSEKKARELGLDSSRWIYPWASTQSNHMLSVAQRPDISRSVGAEVGARVLLNAVGIDAVAIRYADLYSCFPIAVELFADALQLKAGTPLTVTGGMPFAGGPLNNYVLQATVKMVQTLRGDCDACGVVTSVSGLMTKQAYGLWSAQKPRVAFRDIDVTDEVAAACTAVDVLETYEGIVDVVAFTVLLQGMARAIVIADTYDKKRVVLFSDDAQIVEQMQREEWCGRRVRAQGNQFRAVTDDDLYPLNPAYGMGVFRRRIRLWREDHLLHGALEDCNHGFVVAIAHDGTKVTAIDGQHKRVPFSTCGGAIVPLQTLVGCELSSTALVLRTHAGPRANCTHWLDLAVLAIVHSQRADAVCEYDIEVTDENAMGDAQELRVWRNGVLVHDWRYQMGVIVSPEILNGATLFQGFSSRAAAVFTDEDELEAALILQKGNFVAQARRFDLESQVGDRASAHKEMAGVCFSYSPERSSDAIRLAGTLRDFTNTPELLLKFV